MAALGLLAIASAHGAAGGAEIDPACCAYPERDPRDYNYPYSHLLYAGIVPDVVGAFVALTELRAQFASGAAVEYGKPLRLEQMQDAPAVSFDLVNASEPGALYTLMAVDPDSPSRDRPTDRARLLWLVHDIPGTDVSAGSTLAEYAPPAPELCPAADLLCLDEHRVALVLWEQHFGPLELEEEDVRIPRGGPEGPRLRYKARDFAARHDLGLPVAVNFLEVRHPAAESGGGPGVKEEL